VVEGVVAGQAWTRPAAKGAASPHDGLLGRAFALHAYSRVPIFREFQIGAQLGDQPPMLDLVFVRHRVLVRLVVQTNFGTPFVLRQNDGQLGHGAPLNIISRIEIVAELW
jgi:hypothetical protein